MAAEFPKHRLNKLFLGGLPDEVEEEEIRTHFSQYGQIIDLVIIRDKVTRQNRGFGFVTFKEARAMKEAFRIKQRLRDKTLDIKVAEPKKQSEKEKTVDVSQIKKIFIGGISKEVTPAIFREHFEKYGPIADIVLIQDRDTNAPRGFGFVTYHDSETVQRVMSDYGNHCLLGKWVDCKLALPRFNEETDTCALRGYGQSENQRGYHYDADLYPSNVRHIRVNGHNTGKMKPVKCPKKKRSKKRTNPSDKPNDPANHDDRVEDKIKGELKSNYSFRLSPPLHLLSSKRFLKILEGNRIASDDKFIYFRVVKGQIRQVKTKIPVGSISMPSRKVVDKSPSIRVTETKLELKQQDWAIKVTQVIGEQDNSIKALPFCLETCMDIPLTSRPSESGEKTTRHKANLTESDYTYDVKQAIKVSETDIDPSRRSKIDVAVKSPMSSYTPKSFTPKTAANTNSVSTPKGPDTVIPKARTQGRTFQAFSRINTERAEEESLDILEEISLSSINDSAEHLVDNKNADECLERILGSALVSEPSMDKPTSESCRLDQVQLQPIVLLPSSFYNGVSIMSNQYH